MKNNTPAWMYHKDHKPRIFNTEAELKAAKAEGWVDSPAKIGEEPGTPELPSIEEPKPQAEEIIKALDEVDTSLESMTKAQLERYALEMFGVDIDRRRTKADLIAQIKELEADDSARTD